MALRPYLFTQTVTLSASAAGTAQFVVSPGETIRFKRLYYVSTGSFNVTGIRNSAGLRYTNASTDDPITSTTLQNAANSNISLSDFLLSLEIIGSGELDIDLVDTSGASNTVRITLVAEVETP